MKDNEKTILQSAKNKEVELKLHIIALEKRVCRLFYSASFNYYKQ